MLTSRENLHFCSTRSGVEPLLVEERNRERWIGELGEMEVGPCQPLFLVSRTEKWLLKRTLFQAMIGLEPLGYLFWRERQSCSRLSCMRSQKEMNENEIKDKEIKVKNNENEFN